MGFDAVILAGGGSRRMAAGAEPVDKVMLVVGGFTLLQRVVGAARSAGAEQVVCVGPPRAGDDELGVTVAAEDPPAGGPAAALAAALMVVEQPVLVLLAGDLPFVDASTITALVQRILESGPAAGAVVVDDQGVRQWLLSAWRTGPLSAALVDGADVSGRSLRSVLEPLAPVPLAFRLAGPEPPPWFDCDTPHDLARARRATADH